MSYAIISLGGKQYRVREGERLLVDRVKTNEGQTFQPAVLFVGGDGQAELTPSTTVTARVVGHVLGEKVRIGKYRPKVGYKRHTGYRSHLTQIEIEAIGARKATARQAAEPSPVTTPDPKAETAAPVRTAHPPKGYDELTVAQVVEQAPGWRRPNLEAALEHERANANRKGAIAALETALAAKEEH